MADAKEKNYVSDNARLMAEWDWEKNINSPFETTLDSHKTSWWKCDKGHSWQTRIYHRVSDSGCPFCSGHRILSGYNDLTTTNPTLASEWNFEKNGTLLPINVSRSSNKKFGGSVIGGMHGRLQSSIEKTEADALSVQMWMRSEWVRFGKVIAGKTSEA